MLFTVALAVGLVPGTFFDRAEFLQTQSNSS